MRLIVTADLHYDHRNSRPSAERIIDEINRAGCDVLLVIGDVATPPGDAFEQCLLRFTHAGPKLFVPGNHELWTHGLDSYTILVSQLPARVAAVGWQWLADKPFTSGKIGIVGSLGWYDYSFAQPQLGIPRRFYQHKISPGAAGHFGEFKSLLNRRDDIPPQAMQVVARWNDGRFVKLHRSDEQFLDELLGTLRGQLHRLSQLNLDRIVAAIHHLPFGELLPASHSAPWDFTKAYLGSELLGKLLLEFPKVGHVFCGHSHFAAEAQVGHIRAVNIGSGYREKFFRTLTLDD
jgi:Icc-related predicted phosphoesterase